LAAAGIAIGAAWSGLLSNFAAGAFLVMLRPYKVGDDVDVGSASGTVTEIGLFSTRILGADNVVTMVGNAKILGGDIKNYSASKFRRLSRTVVVPDGTPLHAAVARLQAGIAALPHVLAEPAPGVAVADLVEGGVKIEARLCASPEHFGAVSDAVNGLVCEQFGPAA
jgi:small conductance mechanosensitive channel